MQLACRVEITAKSVTFTLTQIPCDNNKNDGISPNINDVNNNYIAIIFCVHRYVLFVNLDLLELFSS